MQVSALLRISTSRTFARTPFPLSSSGCSDGSWLSPMSHAARGCSASSPYRTPSSSTHVTPRRHCEGTQLGLSPLPWDLVWDGAPPQNSTADLWKEDWLCSWTQLDCSGVAFQAHCTEGRVFRSPKTSDWESENGQRELAQVWPATAKVAKKRALPRTNAKWSKLLDDCNLQELGTKWTLKELVFTKKAQAITQAS